jgi:hypothetical protein
MSNYRGITIDRNALLNGAISAVIVFLVTFFYPGPGQGSILTSIALALITWFFGYIVSLIANRYKSTPPESDSSKINK